MGCNCNKSQPIKNQKFERLSLDNPENTKIMAGYAEFTIQQLEDEIDNPNSEIGKKLRSVEDMLNNYWTSITQLQMNPAKILIVAPMKYGDPTQHTYKWAKKAELLATNFGYEVKTIEKDKVTYNNVTETIRQFKPRLFAQFSHGCPNSLIGQNECVITRKFTIDELLNMQSSNNPEKIDTFKKIINPMGDISCPGICTLDDNVCNPICTNETNINTLNNTIIYATACFSAKQLGICSIKHGVESYIGFQDLLMFPVDKLNSQDIFGEVQLKFYESLLLGKTITEAEQDMIQLEDSYIRKYKHIKYISLPLLWNRVNRKIIGNKDNSIY